MNFKLAACRSCAACSLEPHLEFEDAQIILCFFMCQQMLDLLHLVFEQMSKVRGAGAHVSPPDPHSLSRCSKNADITGMAAPAGGKRYNRCPHLTYTGA